jgi:hypothetical protein
VPEGAEDLRAAPSTADAAPPVSTLAPPGDHRAALVQALTEGAARAFAAGDTRAALLAINTVRTLIGHESEPDAPLPGAALTPPSSSRR